MYQRNVFLFCFFYLFSISVSADNQCRVIDKVLNSAIYSGKCINGLANGYGTARHKTLAISYKGLFKNGRFNGSGKFTMEKKDKTKKIWEGRWKNGELNGYGKLTSTKNSGINYKGQWINGKRQGQGVQKETDGRVFKGLFRNGHWSKGRLTFPDGSYTQGQWINGKLNGYVIEKIKTGAIFKGQYKNGRRHGKGQVIFTDGTNTTGVWKNGKVVGGEALKLVTKPKYRRLPTYAPRTPIGTVIESQIDGDFEGWEGETIFKLMNGQIWQQSQYSYTYHYAFMPNVLIYPSNGRYKMKVDGVNETIYVQQLR